jgi:hypothetical protein
MFPTTRSSVAGSLLASAWNLRLRTEFVEIDDYLVSPEKETFMGRGILLWLLGVPIPIIILILLFWR